MTESKFKKVVVACIVGAIMLIVVLVSVLIYQLVSISSYVKERDLLISEIVRVQQLIKDNGDEEEIRKTREWIEKRARELGYRYEDDIILDGNDIIIDNTRYEDVLGTNP